MDRDIRDQLRDTLATGMTDAHADTLFACLERHELEPGHQLFRYGIEADRLYYLCSGSLVASIEAEEKRLVLGRVEPGRWLGEVNLIDAGPASATVTVEERAVVYSLCHTSLARLRGEHPDVAATLLATLTRDLAARVRRTSAGLLEQVNDQEFRVSRPEAKRGWLSAAVSKLFSSAEPR